MRYLHQILLSELENHTEEETEGVEERVKIEDIRRKRPSKLTRSKLIGTHTDCGKNERAYADLRQLFCIYTIAFSLILLYDS